MADEMKKSAGGNDVEENKLWAVLGYLGILCLIPLWVRRIRHSLSTCKQG